MESTNALVPELAIVPSVAIISSLVNPIPLSEILMVLAFLSMAIVMAPSKVLFASPALSVSNFRLLIASEAFEMSSRRKISR